MFYLLKKNFRDFWSLKGEFLSILILSILGIFLFSGYTNGWNGMQIEFNKWAESSNLSDVWISGADISEEQIKKISNLTGVKDVQAETVVDINVGRDSSSEHQLRVIIPKTNTISKVDTIEGEQFSIDKDGIWIDQGHAEENDYKVGDFISLWIDGKEVELEIKGIILSPNYIGYTGPNNSVIYDSKLYGYAYTSSKNIELKEIITTNQLLLKVSDNVDMEVLKENVEEVLGMNFTNLTSRNNYMYISNYLQRIQMLRSMSILFSSIAFLLVILTVSTTMQRLVKNQQSIIGTLKALGFRNRSIITHYSFFGFLVTLLGGVIGAIIGPLVLTPFYLNLQKNQFSMVNWEGKGSIMTILLIILLVVLGTFSALLSSRSTIKNSPSEILRPSLSGASKKTFLEIFTRFWENLSFEWKWVLRDIFKNKTKTLIAIIGIIGSLALLMTSLNDQYSLQKNNEDLYGKQYSYITKVTVNYGISEEIKQELLSIVSNDGQWISENSATVKTSNNSEIGTISVIDSGLFLHIADKDGEIITLENNELVISKQFAERLDIKKGDTIQFRPIGQTHFITGNVSEIAYVSSPQGIFVSKKYWEEQDLEFTATSLLTGKKINIDEISDYPYVKSVTTIDEQLSDANLVLKNISGVIMVMSIVAVLLSWTLLYNLGALNFTERFREYATMKVLGFRQKEIRSIIIRENMLYFVIGWILSLPAGVGFLNIFTAMSSTDSSDVFPYVSIMRVILATTIIFICISVISLIISSKVKKIDMIEALKSVE